MLEIIKKIFAILSNLPAFANLFKKASETGKIDPVDALDALTTISPSTKKCADVAVQTAQQGGGIPDIARALTNVGEVEVMGQKLNTRTLIPDLKRVGGVCSALAGMLEKMPGQSPDEIANFGRQASDLSNWTDIAK